MQLSDCSVICAPTPLRASPLIFILLSSEAFPSVLQCFHIPNVFCFTFYTVMCTFSFVVGGSK